MKKKFILAIFGISLLFMACQEDSYYNDYDMGDKNSSILTEAMKLIEDNHDFVSLPDLDKTLKGGNATRSSGSNQSLRYEEEDFIFDWGEADVMESKLSEVVIAPVRYNKEMALRTITLEGNSRKGRLPRCIRYSICEKCWRLDRRMPTSSLLLPTATISMLVKRKERIYNCILTLREVISVVFCSSLQYMARLLMVSVMRMVASVTI